MSQFTIRRPEEGEVLNVVGDRMRFLVDSDATDGKCCIFELFTDPGVGPPLHRHGRDDEFFHIVEGTVKFVVDGKEVVLGPGASVLAPRGSVHAFRNVGNAPSRMIVMCFPGGLEGPFREVDRLTRDGMATPKAIVLAFKKFDLDILGPPLA